MKYIHKTSLMAKSRQCVANNSAFIKESLGVRDSQKLPWDFQKAMPTGGEDMSRTRMTTMSLLLLALYPLVIFDSDY